MPIGAAEGILEVENAKFSASEFIATTSVGIGTTSASAYPLVIFKETEPEIRIQEGDTQSSGARFYSNNSNLYIQTGTDFSSGSSGDIAFQTMGGQATHVIVKGDGKVGVGTESPDGALHVITGGNTGQGLTLQNSDVKTVLSHLPGGNNRGFIQTFSGVTSSIPTSSSTKYPLCLQPYGSYVGIGKTNPSATLDVNGIIRNQNPSWCLYKASTSYNSGYLRWDTVKASAINCTMTASGGYYDRVTITVPGRYFIGFDSFGDPNQSGVGWQYDIRKNAIEQVRSYFNPPNNNYSAMGGLRVVLDLAVNDYIQIRSDNSVHHSGSSPFYGFLIG